MYSLTHTPSGVVANGAFEIVPFDEVVATRSRAINTQQQMP